MAGTTGTTAKAGADHHSQQSENSSQNCQKENHLLFSLINQVDSVSQPQSLHVTMLYIFPHSSQCFCSEISCKNGRNVFLNLVAVNGQQFCVADSSGGGGSMWLFGGQWPVQCTVYQAQFGYTGTAPRTLTTQAAHSDAS